MGDSNMPLEARQRSYRMWEAREALGISQKTLVDWLQRAGYNLDLVVERADPTDLRQRYLAEKIVEVLADQHGRRDILDHWRHVRNLEDENRRLLRRVGELELEVQALRVLLKQQVLA